VNWAGFSDSAPELSGLVEVLILRPRLAILGTIRRDGSPRISPCEAYVVDAELLLGMMWRSKKALDLLRDPRLAVHSPQSSPDGKTGDVKLYGRAISVEDEALRTRYGDVLEATIQWRPAEPYHLIATDIEAAGYITFAEDRTTLRWSASRGLERIPHPDD
jgi:hypothetical protein